MYSEQDIQKMQDAQIKAAKNMAMNAYPLQSSLYQWAIMNAYTPPKPRVNAIGIPLIKIS